jgi:hypothetical protein
LVVLLLLLILFLLLLLRGRKKLTETPRDTKADVVVAVRRPGPDAVGRPDGPRSIEERPAANHTAIGILDVGRVGVG